MARLVMLSGNIGVSDNADVDTVIHPRTKRPIQAFGLRKIVIWNSNGTVGAAMSGMGNSDDLGTYGILEVFDEYNGSYVSTLGQNESGQNRDTADEANKVLRIPVSGKSRIVLELPGNGMFFRDGIRVAVGSDANFNDGKDMYYQFVGYEY